MRKILFTTYPDDGPCFLVETDMPVKEAEDIEFSTSKSELRRIIEEKGYKAKIQSIDAVMDWVNGFVEER